MTAIAATAAIDPRGELEAAIKIRDAVRETADASASALELARKFLADLTSKVKAFDDLDKRIASERAGVLKAAMAKGEQPRFATSPELSAAMAGKVEAENQLAAATTAIAELEAEVAGHKERLRECEDEIGRKAEGVIQSVADEMATQIELLETRALDIRAALDGMPRLTRTEAGRSVLYRVSTGVRKIVETNPLTEIGTSNMPRNLRAKALAGVWRSFADALRSDPSAIFDGGDRNGQQ